MQTDQEQKSIGKTFGIIAWLCVFGVLYLFFDDQLAKQWNPNTEVESTLINNVATVTLERNRAGHYVANGFINNQPVTFMLDTGATHVAIPQAIADRLGLQKGMRYNTQTANGQATSYATVLTHLTLGSIQLSNVQASISPSFHSDEILLGMSALKQLEFTQRGNTLTLKQY